MFFYKIIVRILLLLIVSTELQGQAQTTEYIIGMGENSDSIIITASNSQANQNSETTLSEAGFKPNLNAASRFLSQATMGYNFEDIEYVADTGIEDWIDEQMLINRPYSLLSKVIEYHDYKKDSLGDPNAGASIRFWDYAWWQYHVTSSDLLRQRIAFALSELLVISRFSNFDNEPYAFASYYDILLDHAFGNYRDLIEEITYHPAMSLYLTYMNNPKSDTINNIFPDENYAREIMQLFTIGLFQLNNDGTLVLDTLGDPIPTYDNLDIAEFSKIFTGLSWGDRPSFGSKNAYHDTSYVIDLQMFNGFHEPGTKDLLNGFQVPDRNPVDGVADIDDALDNLFNHQNAGPFLSRFLIQRLVTSNPSAEYIDRVATIFNDNGNGVRGDLSSVIKAILLDPVARACSSGNDITFGMLREPFVRYMQLNKAFDISTLSGNHRNAMYYVQEFVKQKPNTSPSVFNFFQYDYQPIGPIEQLNLFAPEFQITNTQTITGYINGLYRWVIENNPAEEWDLFNGEDDSGYEDEIGSLDFSDEELLADDNHLHMLVDRLNLILAQGRLSPMAETTIINAIKEFDQEDTDDLIIRTRLAIYLVMSSPEYLINR
ncbi:MAG: DUF1800 domain-containing protein [Bacteroidia bacterium]|nr:DUF1800 domain-containing protein [Bacteroidia bacterium]